MLKTKKRNTTTTLYRAFTPGVRQFYAASSHGMNISVCHISLGLLSFLCFLYLLVTFFLSVLSLITIRIENWRKGVAYKRRTLLASLNAIGVVESSGSNYIALYYNHLYGQHLINVSGKK